MKKPKDITDLASRLANAAATPLVAPIAASPAAEDISQTTSPDKHRKAPNRGSVPVFLRLSQALYKHYDAEAVRRTKQTGRGVTVQQVILDRLSEAQP